MQKKVLLIGGSGTLGSYVTHYLLKDICKIDVICLEDNVYTKKVHYFKANADFTFLKEFLKNRHYDAIVNFIIYENAENYKPIHEFLCSKTEQLVFLSSYRVYADEEHPITENAPHLYDVIKDERFLEEDNYAVPKSKCEKYILFESKAKNCTIVRPVISFSDKRYDIVFPLSQSEISEHIEKNTPVFLPKEAQNLTAGLDWAKNSGKIIAALLFKKEALGEAFTVSSAQNLTWGEIANIYTEKAGLKFKWISTEEYIDLNPYLKENPWIIIYDRLFNRTVDNSKVLKVTGLSKNDFYSIKHGIEHELKNVLK